MYLNSEQIKINNFLIQEKYNNFSKSFLTLLSLDLDIDKKDLKTFSKLVRLRDIENLLKKLIEVFVIFDISLVPNSSMRVKKHREHIKAKGYKTLSFLLPPAEHEKLKKMKSKKNMSYSEFIIFLMSEADI